MTMSMLVNAAEKVETRLAVVQDGRLEEYFVERSSHETLVGNIYKGKVENIHPALQAAFVGIGLEKNGFLHASETRSQDHLMAFGTKGKTRRPQRTSPLIQKALKPGQEVIVQVIRDGFGEKGPSLTMDVSLPGRFLVLTPSMTMVGVSKKIQDRGERGRLRSIVRQLAPKEPVGFIIRTAGADTTEQDLKADIEYLVRSWTNVVGRARNSPSPVELFREEDLTIRTVRDMFTKQVEEIVVDSAAVYRRLLSFFERTMSKYRDRVKYYSGSMPLLMRYGIEEQVKELDQKSVRLPSGGTIVIEQTEALTAVDVNSGRYTRERSPEETALQTNMEAAREIMRQFRLRDLGGIAVIDFIDLKFARHRKMVDDLLVRESHRDKSQVSILAMSDFGLVQIARQKIRPSLRLVTNDPCPVCKGLGYVKSVESIALEVLRLIRIEAGRPDVRVVEAAVNAEVAQFLAGKGKEIEKIELQTGKRINVSVNATAAVDQVAIQGQGEETRKPEDQGIRELGDQATSESEENGNGEAEKGEGELENGEGSGEQNNSN